MQRSVFLGFCVVLLSHCGPPGEAPPGGDGDPLAVFAIANEGFLVAGASGKVLVDALFAEHDYYDVPSVESRRRMVLGEPPFDDIDLVLATHDHADHFDALTAAEFLKHHPESVFLATPRVVERMREHCPDFAGIAERVHTLELPLGASGERTVGGIPLWIHNSGHSGNRLEWQNFMYAFDLGEWTIFHEGDSPLDQEGFAAFRETGRRADIAFLHSWFMTRDRGLRIVQDDLQAGRVFLMHIPARFREETLARLEAIRARFPEAYWLEPGSGERDLRRIEKESAPAAAPSH